MFAVCLQRCSIHTAREGHPPPSRAPHVAGAGDLPREEAGVRGAVQGGEAAGGGRRVRPGGGGAPVLLQTRVPPSAFLPQLNILVR